MTPHELIRASAGSGKTYQLTSRYLALLAADVPADRILATTFTRKAAGEILGRVLLRLANGEGDRRTLRALVAKLDDVCVLGGREGQGIGSALIDSLKAELRSRGVRRIDTSCHLENRRARDFYVRLGFRSLEEERLALVL